MLEQLPISTARNFSLDIAGEMTLQRKRRMKDLFNVQIKNRLLEMINISSSRKLPFYIPVYVAETVL